MVPIKINLADKNNYGSKRTVTKDFYIVIHYTANDGDTDESNAKFFKNNVTKSSANYFVDDDSITISVPDDYVPYSVGGSRYSDYKTTGGARLYKKAINKNTINIELCDTKKDGKIQASNKTIENALDLVNYLMNKYGIPKENVIRHFDVTGKKCPAYWVDDSKWKKEFWNRINEAAKIEEPVMNDSSFKVKIKVKSLNIRSGAGTKYSIVGTVSKGGVYTIVDTLDKWGKLKSGVGWINISKSYVDRV